MEFFVESGDDGRTKAVQVTGPAGAPPQVAMPEPRLSMWVQAVLGVVSTEAEACPRFGAARRRALRSYWAVKQLAPSPLHAASVHHGTPYWLDVLFEAVASAHLMACALSGD